MFKRKLLMFFALMLTAVLCVGAVSAADSATPWSSVSLWMYQADASGDSSPGELEIFYRVTGKGSVTTCGVSSIKIYKSNGTHVATINGTISNGLLVSGNKHNGSYLYDGEAGTSYYTEVTLYAGNSSTSDSRTVITDIVTVS